MHPAVESAPFFLIIVINKSVHSSPARTHEENGKKRTKKTINVGNTQKRGEARKRKPRTHSQPHHHRPHPRLREKTKASLGDGNKQRACGARTTAAPRRLVGHRLLRVFVLFAFSVDRRGLFTRSKMHASDTAAVTYRGPPPPSCLQGSRTSGRCCRPGRTPGTGSRCSWPGEGCRCPTKRGADMKSGAQVFRCRGCGCFAGGGSRGCIATMPPIGRDERTRPRTGSPQRAQQISAELVSVATT